MKTYQNIYQNGAWQSPLTSSMAQLVLLFGNREPAGDKLVQTALREAFPEAQIVGCSTSGEIQGDRIFDDSLCLTAIEFDSSSVSVHHTQIAEHAELLDAAYFLAKQLPEKGLKHVLVIADGQQVNGTLLIEGLKEKLAPTVGLSGGLAGDGTRFNETVVWHNEHVAPGQIVVIGFYGNNICFGHGCEGGWVPFGPERRVTRSQANVLYSLDDKPALELYKTYLGEHVSELPASALLFPLLIKSKNSEDRLTRTILNIDEKDNSMVFAGDIPEGASVQLMQASFERLVDGAKNAARSALPLDASLQGEGLALLVSCVGRRLVLNHGVEEELESVSDILGKSWSISGFYSYGEISPTTGSNVCALHNQTMTITTIFERNA